MKVIFPYTDRFEPWPDDRALFGPADVDTVPGSAIAEYHGSLPLTEYIAEQGFDEYLDGQDLMELMGIDAYNAVKAAPSAQYFVDIGTALNAAGKKVWVKHPAYIYAVDSFLAGGLIDQATHDNMLLGTPL